jgi:hypothetical protein
MVSVKIFFGKHRWQSWVGTFLAILFSVAIIDLPQWLDSVWDLADKFSGRTITTHEISWLFWITIPVGIMMIAFAIWTIHKSQSNNTDGDEQNLNNRIRYTLQQLNTIDLKFKNKAVQQYTSLFSLKNLLELLDVIGNANKEHKELLKNAKKKIGKKKLKKNNIQKRQQIDGLFAMFRQGLDDEKWDFPKIIAFANELDRFPKIQDNRYLGIKARRERSKQWKKQFDILSNIKSEHSNIFADKELEKMVVDYIDYSFVCSSICLLIEIYNTYVPIDIQPTEYIDKDLYSPYVKMQNRITRTLQNILNRVESMQKGEPFLFITSWGFSWMAKETKKNVKEYQRRLQWYDVIITNPSQTNPLGIQRIVLTWDNVRDKRQVSAFTPVVGKIKVRDDEKEQDKIGDIGDTLYLLPNESKPGTLAFILESGGNLDKTFTMGRMEDTKIILTDSNGNRYKYNAQTNDILN